MTLGWQDPPHGPGSAWTWGGEVGCSVRFCPLLQVTAQSTVNLVTGLCAPQEGLVCLFTWVQVSGQRSGCRTDLLTFSPMGSHPVSCGPRANLVSGPPPSHFEAPATDHGDLHNYRGPLRSLALREKS